MRRGIPASGSAERESRGTHRPCGWIPIASAGLGFEDDGSWDSPCVQCRCGTYPRCPGACGIIRVPLPATGRGWAHSPSTWQRPAPGRRAEWLEIQEARMQPLPAKCQQWRGAGDRPSGSRCDRCAPGNWAQREAKALPRDTNRRRGCRKAAQGPEQGLREPDGVPREAQPKPPGPGGTGPGLPTRHPRTRRTLAGFPCGADGAWA